MIKIIKRIFKNKCVKVLGCVILVAIIFVAVFTAIFVTKCGSAQSGFQPINDEVSQTQKDVRASIEKYQRTEETTYLTYPEWYLVFNPQEYAASLETNKPSHFPYFASIGQFWSGYCQMYGITRNHYEFNAENHLVVVVIGASFSFEYVVKGVYENTIGRVFEFLGGGVQTEEDIYAAKIAKEYGDFIPTDPWYAFPFGRALTGLWKDTSFLGSGILRKWERKMFLSFEYGLKAAYAKLIGFGTHTALGVADTEVYAHVSGASAQILKDPRVRDVKLLADGSRIITVPHYQGFTDTVPGFAKQGLRFLDVAGNDEILLTVVAPADWQYDLKNGAELFTMPILIDSTLKRVAIQVPVRHLNEILNQLAAEGVRIEHLFDY